MNSLALWCLFLATFLPAQLSETRIPNGAGVVVDGKLTPGEWDYAASAQIRVQPDWNIQVRFRHDDKNLYFLFQGIKRGKERLYPEIFLDPQNLRSLQWQQGQWWFHVSYNLCEGNGEPNVYTRNGVLQCAHQKDGWEANNPPGPNTEAVEVRISFAKLGIQPRSGLRFGLALAVTNATGDRAQKWFFWPETAKVSWPASWEQVVLD